MWDRFCDWYLELIKGQIDGETSAVAGWALDQILVMLHPFMPFITEELWHAQGARPYDLIVAKWPEPGAKIDKAAKVEVDWLIDLVSAVRTARSELCIPPSARTDIALIVDMIGVHVDENGAKASKNREVSDRFLRNRAAIGRLARLDLFWPDYSPNALDLKTGQLIESNGKPLDSKASLQIVVDGLGFVIPLEGVIDIGAEKARLSKALEASQKEAKSLEGRLANPSFVERAKPEAVEKARADHAQHAAEVARLEAALARLG